MPSLIRKRNWNGKYTSASVKSIDCDRNCASLRKSEPVVRDDTPARRPTEFADGDYRDSTMSGDLHAVIRRQLPVWLVMFELLFAFSSACAEPASQSKRDELQIKREVTLIPVYADPLQAAGIVRTCCRTRGLEVLVDGLPEF